MNTPIRWGTLLDADNHRILWAIGREISCEAHEVVGSKAAFAPDLCRTRLTGYGKVLRVSQFTRTRVLAHHTF